MQAIPQDTRQLPKAGLDEASFRSLFDLHRRAIHRFFEKRGCNAGDCEDLCQETFLCLYQGLGSFRGEALFKTWVFQIATNVYKQSLRRRHTAKRTGHEVSLDGDEVAGERPLVGPLGQTLLKERLNFLREAMEDLTPQMRQCVMLRGFQELDYAEIADVLQISVSAVKVQLFRARRKLTHRLDDRFGDFNL